MSGIDYRLKQAQKKIESLEENPQNHLKIRIGPFRTKRITVRHEKLVTATKGDRYAGSQIYGFTFKCIPAKESQRYSNVEHVENELRNRFPTFATALKNFYGENNLQGDEDNVSTWSSPHVGVPLTKAKYVEPDIVNYINFVLSASPEKRESKEFQAILKRERKRLATIHKGYDEFKRIMFESKKIGGNFEDVLSWYGLDPNDNLRDIGASVEVKGFLKALGRASQFYISDSGLIVKLRGETVTNDEMIQCAKKMCAIRALISRGPKGLLIHDDKRLLIYFYSLLMIATIVVSILKTNWLNGPFEIVGSFLTALVSIPALWSFLSCEEDPVWAALRGQRYLYDDEDVMKTFSLTEEDIAIYGLVDGGCSFLSNKQMCHNPDKGTELIKPGPKTLTTTEHLRKVGIFVGHHLARRIWEEKNYKVIHDSNEVLHITDHISKSKWSSGLRYEMGVG